MKPFPTVLTLLNFTYCKCLFCSSYLALVNKSSSNLITEQILEAGPLLESFGNAKTIKNDNSSRFGKYVQVYFQESVQIKPSYSQMSVSYSWLNLILFLFRGKIIGAKINEYLLEKSRIVTQNVGERNYHVFYEILRGLGKDLKEKYGLGSAEKYFYLNQGGATSISGKEDFRDFSGLLGSMEILGLNSDEIDAVLRILAAGDGTSLNFIALKQALALVNFPVAC